MKSRTTELPDHERSHTLAGVPKFGACWVPASVKASDGDMPSDGHSSDDGRQVAATEATSTYQYASPGCGRTASSTVMQRCRLRVVMMCERLGGAQADFASMSPEKAARGLSLLFLYEDMIFKFYHAMRVQTSEAVSLP